MNYYLSSIINHRTKKTLVNNSFLIWQTWWVGQVPVCFTTRADKDLFARFEKCDSLLANLCLCSLDLLAVVLQSNNTKASAKQIQNIQRKVSGHIV